VAIYTHEELTVNRPFYAFGVLLALLALAMLAVSSTTRTRMVQSPQSHDKGSLLSPTPRGGAIYVIILPEGDASPLTQGVAWKALTPAVVAEAPFDASGVPQITPIGVTFAAHDAAAAFSPGSADCRSQYDPQYDELIYGQDESRLLSSSFSPVKRDPGATAVAWDDHASDELILFRSLAAPSYSFRRLTEVTIGWLAPYDDISRLRNWLIAQAECLARARQIADRAAAIMWTEYAELMQGIVPEAHVQAAAPRESPASGTVRSSGWLLHFAVSSLSRAGVALKQAASQLQQAEGQYRPVVPASNGE
jgi:hypothetical protein